MSARIEWRKGQYTTDTGYVSGKRMFSVTLGMTSRGSKEPYELDTRLPGSRPSQRTFESKEAAKDYAERFLVAWVKSIGAESPVLTSIEGGEE